MTQTKLLRRELLVELDQGLVTGIRQRTNRPLEQAADNATCSRVDWTSATSRDMAGRAGNNSSPRVNAAECQALGGSGGWSLVR